MALFEYQGLNARGGKTRGSVEADSVRTARQKLKQQGVFPTTLREAREKEAASQSAQVALGLSRVTPQQLALATRQLATLVSAGIPLVEALKALGEQIDHPRMKRVIAEVTDRVNEGATLADALKNYPKVFPRLYVNMVASGEASGSLEVVLERLASLLEAQAELRRTVLSALAYPIFMVLLCLGVVILLLAYVVPEITSIFQEQKKSLPLPTRIVIALSNFTQNYWLPAGIAVLVLLWLIQKWGETAAGRKFIDTVKLRLLIVGPLTVKVATARFARTLGTMLASGVELLMALSIVKNIVGNIVLEEAIDNALIGVREGRSLANELNRSGVFPRMLVHMIAIGERTGQLEQMLQRAATNYESEVNAVVQGMTRILEPILILIIALIVAGILASVMMPMIEMTQIRR